MAESDREITKRRVTMGNPTIVDYKKDGSPVVQVIGPVDYVHPEHLDAYVADARTRWQHVEVSDEPDAGPGGWGGEYTLPEHIDHEEAGVTRAAEEG